LRKLTVRLLMLVGLITLSLLVMALNRHPPVVIVGPVDMGKGIVGLLGKGTSRNDVIRFFGPPLRSRETLEQARRRYDIDPIESDYFAGIYAELNWYNDDTLASLTFDFDQFARKYRSELKVILRRGEKQVLLSRETIFNKDLIARICTQLGLKASDVELHEYSLYLNPTAYGYATVMHFSYDDGHLESLYVSMR